MKKIILFRHAKSKKIDGVTSDHGRKLAQHGVEDAPKIGNYLSKENILPDVIYCSTALRAKQTLDLFLEQINQDIKVNYDKMIYADGENRIPEICLKIDDTVNTVMFVGHNPDIEYLTEVFTGKKFPYPKFSTSSIAVIKFNMDNWKSIAEEFGKLERFITPKIV